jgi:hypothetical protein
MGVQTKLVDNLPDLLQRVIADDKKGFQFTDSNNSPLHYPGITGEKDAILHQGNMYQIFIIAVVEKYGVVADHSQPSGEFTYIQVDYKF